MAEKNTNLVCSEKIFILLALYYGEVIFRHTEVRVFGSIFDCRRYFTTSLWPPEEPKCSAFQPVYKWIWLLLRYLLFKMVSNLRSIIKRKHFWLHKHANNIKIALLCSPKKNVFFRLQGNAITVSNYFSSYRFTNSRSHRFQSAQRILKKHKPDLWHLSSCS